MQTLQEIKSIENRLLEQLEVILTNLSAIRKTKSLLENTTKVSKEIEAKPRGRKASNSSPARKRVKPAAQSKDEFRIILDAASEYFQSVENKPTFIREIKDIIESKGLKIPGANPGATLAAILRGDGRFNLVDKKERLWALK